MPLAKPKPRAPKSNKRTPLRMIRPNTLEHRLILDLHACIKQYGWTVQSVSETAGVAKGAIRGWLTESAWGSPKLRSFCAVLEALGLTMVILPAEELDAGS